MYLSNKIKRKMPDFSVENRYAKRTIIGVDEVGRGPWAGPVVACAFMFTDRSLFKDILCFIQDSKKVTPKRRQILCDFFQEYAGKGCSYAIAEASVSEIDTLNIRRATFLAMTRAVEGLKVQNPMVLVDGNALPAWSYEAISLIKGDQISFSIAAASILAKVYRDDLMQQHAKEYPGYGWESNAGYGTKVHQEGLAQKGVTPHHRVSFSPIKKRLASF
ncbi:MAG: ribonuclease HII [Gammaproteobacteria bacterium]|nr:ribonuclease HII [Gammaproteobacteria bacterium]